MSKKFILHLAILLIVIQPLFSFGQLNSNSPSDIPLIERSLFFDNPEISGSQLSSDGKRISFLKAYKGVMNIWGEGFQSVI